MADESYYMRYWVYSRAQLEQQMKIHNVRNVSDLRLRKIVVNGVAKPFTCELKSMKDIKFSDSVLVTKGDKRIMQIIQ